MAEKDSWYTGALDMGTSAYETGAGYFDTGASFVKESLKGKPQNVIDALAGGDRKGAISAILGGKPPTSPADWRVRLSCAPGANYLYKAPSVKQGSLMFPLLASRGCVWPYTPTVNMQYQAKYDHKSPTHSNYPNHAYQYSQVSTIGISGDFTAQTASEAKYLLACMMFLRASTKMFWGSDPQAGMPPPVLYLNGYGENFFPNVPVVITDFTTSLPPDVDYVEVVEREAVSFGTKADEKLTRVPSSITMTVSCEPIYSRKRITEFSFEKFASGSLLGSSADGGFKGGFV